MRLIEKTMTHASVGDGSSASSDESANTLVDEPQRRRRLISQRALEKARDTRTAPRPAMTLALQALRGPSLLKPWHAEVARRVLVGESVVSIAAAMRRTASTIHRLVRSAPFQELLAGYERKLHETFMSKADVFESIIQEGPKSLDVMRELRDTCDDPAVRVRAASNLLDRYTALRGQRVEGSVTLPAKAIETLTLVIAEINSFRAERVESAA